MHDLCSMFLLPKPKLSPLNTFKLKVKNNRSGTSKETTTVFKSNRIHGRKEVALEMKSFLQICSLILWFKAEMKYIMQFFFKRTHQISGYHKTLLYYYTAHYLLYVNRCLRDKPNILFLM